MTDVEVFARDDAISDGSSDALANEILPVVLGLSGSGNAPETCSDGGVDEVGSVLTLPGGSVKEVLARDGLPIEGLLRHSATRLLLLGAWKSRAIGEVGQNERPRDGCIYR